MNLSEESGSIAIDAMGGDLGPAEVVAGVRLFLDLGLLGSEDKIFLVGNEELLEPLLREEGIANDPRIVIFHASEVIGMEDRPVLALKQKKDASMVRAVELLKMGNCNAAISCGNTGALMACGTLKLRTLPGVTKPAIATAIPSRKNHFILIDAGANPMAKADDLAFNAILGHHYAKITLRRPRPRVGLLSIGTEEGKGNDTILEAHEHLKRLRDIIDYQGLIEGSVLFDGDIDVVVCDGFVGNVLLKSIESLAGMLKTLASREIRKNPLRMLGAFLSRGAFSAIRESINKDRYGGAPLLGLNGNLFKAHGSSNRHAIMNAIKIASAFTTEHLRDHAIGDIAIAQIRVRERPAGASQEPERPNATLSR